MKSTTINQMMIQTQIVMMRRISKMSSNREIKVKGQRINSMRQDPIVAKRNQLLCKDLSNRSWMTDKISIVKEVFLTNRIEVRKIERTSRAIVRGARLIIKVMAKEASWINEARTKEAGSSSPRIKAPKTPRIKPRPMMNRVNLHIVMIKARKANLQRFPA